MIIRTKRRLWMAIAVLIVLTLAISLLGSRQWRAPQSPPRGGVVSGPLTTRVYRLDPQLVVSNFTELGFTSSTNVTVRFRDLLTLAGGDFRERPPSTALQFYRRVPPSLQGFARNLCANLGVSLATNPPPRSQVFFDLNNGLMLLRATPEDLATASLAIMLLGPRTNFFDGIEPKDMEEFRETMGRGTPYAQSAPPDERPLPVRLPEAVETVNCAIMDPAWFHAQVLHAPRTGGHAEIQRLLLDFFASRGIDFRAATPRGPKVLLYNHRNGVMLVRATRREIAIVERIVMALNYAAYDALPAAAPAAAK